MALTRGRAGRPGRGGPTTGCAGHQRPDGSWPRTIVAGDGDRRRRRDATTPPTSPSASGTSCWSPATAAFVGADVADGPPRRSTSCCDLQPPDGEIAWARDAARLRRRPRPADRLLEHLPSLRCAVALAELARRAAARLGAGRRPARPRGGAAPRPVRGQEPVLDGLVLPGARRRRARPGRATGGSTPGWDTSWCRAWACRCVDDQPWVTGAETCELVLALRRRGPERRPPRGCSPTSSTCGTSDGAYWTGWQFAHRRALPGRAQRRTPPRP